MVKIVRNKDVVELYKKGYSIDFIVKSYYRFKTSNDIRNHMFNGNFIVTKKTISIENARREVQEIIINYLNTNCAKWKLCKIRKILQLLEKKAVILFF